MVRSKDCDQRGGAWKPLIHQNHSTACKLQALVYDILPSTTDIVDYAIGLEKLSANEQLFDDAQTAVSL